MALLTVVIPSFRGDQILRESLPRLAGYLSQRGVSYEIVIVDDGSADDRATENVAKANGCRYLSNAINLGKGAAVKKGVLAATGEYVIFTDADLPFGPHSIEYFLSVLRSSEFDVVVGDRTLADSSYLSEISWQRALASRVFRLALGTDLIRDFPDTQCGLKGFRAVAAKRLFAATVTEGFAFDVEILCRAQRLGLRHKRLPVRLENQGRSTVSLIRHGLKTFLELVKIRRRLRVDWQSEPENTSAGFDKAS